MSEEIERWVNYMKKIQILGKLYIQNLLIHNLKNQKNLL